MALHDKEIRRYVALGIILALAVLTAFILWPIAMAIIIGLFLAYALFPVYKRVFKFLGEKNTSALAVCLILVVIIFIPVWFVLPIAIKQIFNMFNAVQGINIGSLVEKILPTASPDLRATIATALITFVGKITSSSLGSLTSIILEFPTFLLQFAVAIFVFFFALRDSDKLKEFMSGISPLKKDKERALAQQFKEITSSIVFGYIVVGILQGVATGIGLLIFGVPNALFLAFLAIFAGMLPMVGPGLIWVPASIYLLTQGQTGAAIGFALYGALFVSTIDNFLRPYLVARRTNIPAVIILIGMIGGLLVFGILGIILGPLILAYMLLFMQAYKNKVLSEMFSSD